MSKEMINCSVTGIRLGLACTLAEFSLRSSAASSLLHKTFRQSVHWFHQAVQQNELIINLITSLMLKIILI